MQVYSVRYIHIYIIMQVSLVIDIGRLYGCIEHHDPLCTWLDHRGMYCDDDAASPPAASEKKMGFLLQQEGAVDAGSSWDRTVSLLEARCPFIRNPEVIYEGIAYRPIALVRRERLRANPPFASAPFAPYVVVQMAERCTRFVSTGFALAQFALRKLGITENGVVGGGVGGGGGVVIRRDGSTRTCSRCLSDAAASLVANALQWKRWHRYVADGRADDLVPGSRLEMCPNMKSGLAATATRASYLRGVAQATGEITQVYRCGVEVRARAWSLGARCFQDMRGLVETGALTLPVGAYEIVRANSERTERELALLHRTTLRRIADRLRRKCGSGVWFGTDFETIDDGRGHFWIFMISTIAVRSGETRMRTETMVSLTRREQRRVLRAWQAWMEDEAAAAGSGGAPLRVLHWAPAEPTFLRRVGATIPRIEWVDVCAMLKQERFAIRGCFGYKLKDVGRVFHALGRTGCTWATDDDAIADGRTAMYAAIAYYNDRRSDDVLARIQAYNRDDVQIMHDIVAWFITNGAR